MLKYAISLLTTSDSTGKGKAAQKAQSQKVAASDKGAQSQPSPAPANISEPRSAPAPSFLQSDTTSPPASSPSGSPESNFSDLFHDDMTDEQYLAATMKEYKLMTKPAKSKSKTTTRKPRLPKWKPWDSTVQIKPKPKRRAKSKKAKESDSDDEPGTSGSRNQFCDLLTLSRFTQSYHPHLR